MAQKLSDKQKVAQILGEVEDKDPAEKPEEEEDPSKEKEVNTPEAEEQEEAEEDPEKPAESEEESETEAGPLTKQFPNLKGETLEEYNKSLEAAYDNSFKEALRMAQELKDNAAVVAQARDIVAKAAAAPSEGAPQTPALNLSTTADEPDWMARARELDREQMTASFEPFKQRYPQVLEPDNFKKFTAASDGVNQTLSAALGRKPKWSELFDGVAGVLGWQPLKDTSKRDNAIKENAAGTRAKGSVTPAPVKKSKVSDAQVDAYMKMFTSKTREEAIKDLSEVVG